MPRKSTATSPYRRKRQGRTDYRHRLKLLISRQTRLVVRLSERNVLAQLIAYEQRGDRVLASASSKEIEKLGWKASRSSLPAAYLVGALLAKKAEKLKEPVTSAILDLGNLTPLPGSRVYAVLRGAVEAGLHVPHSEDVLPPDERISGAHIEEYAKSLKSSDPDRYKEQFSAYIKNKLDPTTFTTYFNTFKEKVTGAR